MAKRGRTSKRGNRVSVENGRETKGRGKASKERNGWEGAGLPQHGDGETCGKMDVGVDAFTFIARSEEKDRNLSNDGYAAERDRGEQTTNYHMVDITRGAGAGKRVPHGRI